MRPDLSLHAQTAILFAMFMFGCLPDTGRFTIGDEAPPTDASTGLDAAAQDAAQDTGPRDTGPRDTSPPDTFPPDTGAPDAPADSGMDAPTDAAAPLVCEGLVSGSLPSSGSCLDPLSGDDREFGAALAISASHLIVGRPEMVNDRGFATGGVNIYERQDSELRLSQTVYVPGADDMGAALALDEETLLVGDPRGSFGEDGRPGFVYEYRRTECGFAYVGRFSSPVEGAAREHERFGGHVALRGDVALVATDIDASITAPNRVYTMMREGRSWRVSATNRCGTMAAIDHRFHVELSSDGQRMVIRNDQEGLICPFIRAATADATWTPLTQITISGSGEQGANVALAGDFLFVGDPTYRGEFVNQGRVRVFRWTGPTLTELPVDFESSTPIAHQNFGRSVAAICGDTSGHDCTLWISARNDREGDTGSLYYAEFDIGEDGVTRIVRNDPCPSESRAHYGRVGAFDRDWAFLGLPAISKVLVAASPAP